MTDYSVLIPVTLALTAFLFVKVLPDYIRWRGGNIRVPFTSQRPEIYHPKILGFKGTIVAQNDFPNGIKRFVVVNPHHKEEYDFIPGELQATLGVGRVYFHPPIDKEVESLRSEYLKLEQRNQDLIEKNADLERNINAMVKERVEQATEIKKAGQQQQVFRK